MNTSASASQFDAPVERLPFRVEVASSDDLIGVTRLRAAAYGKHLPGLAAKLLQPEAEDFQFGNEVFAAVSKLDGSILGTIRTHVNVSRQLPLEASMQLPERYLGSRLVEATRLSVLSHPGSSMVRNALFKAFFLYACGQGVDWMMAAGRRPVDRIYDGLMFADVDEKGRFYPMEHAGNVPHRVMSFVPAHAKALWHSVNHPLYGFVFETNHPDIDLSGAIKLDEAPSAVAVPLGRAQGLGQMACAVGGSVEQIVHAHVGGLDKERRAGVGLGL